MTLRNKMTTGASTDALSDFDHGLPLDILYVLGPDSPGGWLAHALATEQKSDEFRVTEVTSLGLALEQLRLAPYDVVVIDDDAPDCRPHTAIQAVTSVTRDEQAVLVFSAGSSRAEASEFLRSGATSFISLPATTPSELICQLEAAARRDREATELQRLRAWHEQHAQHEQERNLTLMNVQASLIESYQNKAYPHSVIGDPSRHVTYDEAGFNSHSAERHDSMIDDCRDLIRTYVLMGHGGLREEIDRFVQQHRDLGLSAPIMAMQVTRVIYELIRSRGKRSSSHVLHRGNQLLLDLLLTWSDAVETEERHETIGHHSDS